MKEIEEFKIKRAKEITTPQSHNSKTPESLNLPDLDYLLRTNPLAGGAI